MALPRPCHCSCASARRPWTEYPNRKQCGGLRPADNHKCTDRKRMATTRGSVRSGPQPRRVSRGSRGGGGGVKRLRGLSAFLKSLSHSEQFEFPSFQCMIQYPVAIHHNRGEMGEMRGVKFFAPVHSRKFFNGKKKMECPMVSQICT